MMPTLCFVVAPGFLNSFKRHSRSFVMSTSLPEGVTRRRVPLITKDLVTVTNPEVLRKIAASPDIVRPGEAKLPWLLQTFFGATKVYYADENRWFIGMDGDEKNNRLARRKVVENLISNGFTPERIDKLTEAVKSDCDQTHLAAEVAKAVAELVLPLPEGEELPQEVAEATWLSAKELSVAYNPFQFFPALSENRKVQAYLRSVLSDEDELVDFLHHLSSGSQGIGRGLMVMRGDTTTDVHTFFCKNPVLSNGVLRVPAVETTLDGIFPENAPLLPTSIIVMDNMTCAKDTMDSDFLFGMGIEKRQCPFKNLFFDTTAEIQRRMRNES
ncbi:unnamed protein product [Agarophyton chilense]|eukprot:gb/GEZJ01003587.1/.p1 GENE.gb/GEZJ01003587.1/~~gb/GEZJ01003587.1/.p1  ORF type:complete len:328 (+),score=46.53 gb/GEZJ01003587.1/:124-1107(+)